MTGGLETKTNRSICICKTGRLAYDKCAGCVGYNPECPDYVEDKTRRGMIITLSLRKREES
ncbi:MAG: hypothetical protein AABX71_00700 [Nanoarchaeota archaeon]